MHIVESWQKVYKAEFVLHELYLIFLYIYQIQIRLFLTFSYGKGKALDLC